jgi:shikimate kinase
VNRRHLAERGYVVWLQATIEQQLERLARDTKRPLLAGEDRRGKLDAMRETRAPLYREIADLTINGEHENVAAATERCIALIDTHWNRTQAA